MSNSFNAVARKHQLRIAKQTIKNPHLALLGGMSLEQAQEVVKRSKKWSLNIFIELMINPL